MTQRLVGVYFLWADPKLSIYTLTSLLTSFNTACSTISLHRQLKTRVAFLLAVRGYSPTQTHYMNQLKLERRWEKRPNKSRHSSTPTKGCLWSTFIFHTVIILTARIKSHLNGLTLTWHHKINYIYYIFKLETPCTN